MHILVVTFTTGLSWSEAEAVVQERMHAYRAVAGLLQKYYCRGKEPGEGGGVLIFDSLGSLRAFRDSDLAKSIAAAFRLGAPPRIDVLEVFASLYPDRELVAPTAAATA